MSKKKPHKPPEPRELNLVASAVQLDAAAPEGEPQKLRRFSMTAYTGGAMQIAGWRNPVVVDLNGLQMGGQRRPILLDHTRDVDFVLGQSDSIAVMNNQLIVSGQVMAESPKAQQVIALNDKGFAWQASIGARADQVEFVAEGKTAHVNGQDFTGPLNVARRATLGEISFVVLGADENTSAQIAAQAASTQERNDMEFEKWLAEQGFTLDHLSAQQADSLRQMHARQTQPAGTEAPVTAGKEAVATAVADLRAGVAAESKRIAAIRKACAGKFDEIEAKAIDEGWDETRTELEVLRASRPTGPAIHASEHQPLATDLLQAAVCQAGRLEGIDKQFDAKTLEAADKRFKGRIGLQEMLLEAAWTNGYTGRSFRGDMRGIMQAAFSTFSLPGILSNVANKFLLQSFDAVESTWRAISAIRPVNDFKQVTSYRLTGAFEYEEVGPDGELKHGKVGEESFTNQAKTYGKMFSLTRTDLINDDLGALTAAPTRLGRGAALKLNDVFWKAFLDNATFFTTGRKNYASGTDTALSIDGLTKAETMFLDQTDPDGHPLALMAEILLVPNGLFTQGTQLMNATEIRDTTASNKYPTNNPHTGKFRVERSSYLANALYTGYSAKAWYLLADPANLPVIEVAFLNGQERPTVESADADFNTLGIQMRGYHDFGVSKQDYRAAVKMKGEA